MAKKQKELDCTRWPGRNARDPKLLGSRLGLRFLEQDSRRSPRKRKQVSLVRKRMLESLMEVSLRVPSLDPFGDLALECNQQRRRRAKSGVRRCMKMNGKLEERSGPTRSICHVPTTRFRLSGRRRCERPCGTYPTGDLLRTRMANGIRRENSHGNCRRTVNSLPSTTRSRMTTGSDWYGKAQEVKGRSKSVDEWHCYPIGRGKMERNEQVRSPVHSIGKFTPK